MHVSLHGKVVLFSTYLSRFEPLQRLLDKKLEKDNLILIELLAVKLGILLELTNS